MVWDVNCGGQTTTTASASYRTSCTVRAEYSYDHLHTQSSAPPIAIKRMSHTLTEACGMLLPVSVNMTIWRDVLNFFSFRFLPPPVDDGQQKTNDPRAIIALGPHNIYYCQSDDIYRDRLAGGRTALSPAAVVYPIWGMPSNSCWFVARQSPFTNSIVHHCPLPSHLGPLQSFIIQPARF